MYLVPHGQMNTSSASPRNCDVGFRRSFRNWELEFEEWTDLLPLVQRTLHNARSPHSKNIAPITAFIGMDPSKPLSSFIRNETLESVTMKDVDLEPMLNVSNLQSLIK